MAEQLSWPEIVAAVRAYNAYMAISRGENTSTSAWEPTYPTGPVWGAPTGRAARVLSGELSEHDGETNPIPSPIIPPQPASLQHDQWNENLTETEQMQQGIALLQELLGANTPRSSRLRQTVVPTEVITAQNAREALKNSTLEGVAFLYATLASHILSNSDLVMPPDSLGNAERVFGWKGTEKVYPLPGKSGSAKRLMFTRNPDTNAITGITIENITISAPNSAQPERSYTEQDTQFVDAFSDIGNILEEVREAAKEQFSEDETPYNDVVFPQEFIDVVRLGISELNPSDLLTILHSEFDRMEPRIPENSQAEIKLYAHFMAYARTVLDGLEKILKPGSAYGKTYDLWERKGILILRLNKMAEQLGIPSKNASDLIAAAKDAFDVQSATLDAYNERLRQTRMRKLIPPEVTEAPSEQYGMLVTVFYRGRRLNIQKLPGSRTNHADITPHDIEDVLAQLSDLPEGKIDLAMAIRPRRNINDIQYV